MNQEIQIPKYRLYLDESGNHSFKNMESIPYRYLSLLGCIFERINHYKKADLDLKKLKQDFWHGHDPDSPIIFHREEMIRKKNDFSIFKNENILKKFNKRLIEYLKSQNYLIINIILDKKELKNKYYNLINPYEFCLMAILERYCGWLKMQNSQGDVLAESRGGNEDHQLKKAYEEIYNNGTNMRKDNNFFCSVLTSRKIKIKPKLANITGLQIADILAFPLKEKILFDYNIRTTNFTDTFNEIIYNTVKDKLNRRKYNGKINGYGEIFLLK